MKKAATLIVIATLSIGAAGSSHAASCQSVLQAHIDWLSQPVVGAVRKIDLVVSSTNHTFIESPPEVGYLETQLNYGTFLSAIGQAPIPNGTLWGTGQALLNSNRWAGSCNHLGCPRDQPFDPNTTATWHLTLKAAENSLEITKGTASPVSIPLDCSGSAMVAKKANGLSADGHYLYYGNTRYELFLTRSETAETSPWGFR